MVTSEEAGLTRSSKQQTRTTFRLHLVNRLKSLASINEVRNKNAFIIIIGNLETFQQFKRIEPKLLLHIKTIGDRVRPVETAVREKKNIDRTRGIKFYCPENLSGISKEMGE